MTDKCAACGYIGPDHMLDVKEVCRRCGCVLTIHEIECHSMCADCTSLDDMREEIVQSLRGITGKTNGALGEWDRKIFLYHLRMALASAQMKAADF